MEKTKFKLSATQIISIVCLLLMIALVVSQFLPYWTFVNKAKETQTISIFEYIMFPNEKIYKSAFIKDMKNQLVDSGLMEEGTDAVKKLAVNDFAYPHAIMMLLSVFGIAFGPFKLGKPLGIAFNLAVGICGIYQYFSHPIYQLGQNWYLGLVIAAVLTVLSLLNAVLLVIKMLKS